MPREKRIDAHLAVLAAITLGVFFVLGILLQQQFFSLRNFQSMAYQFPEFGCFALAMMIAMISGGIDLSVIANANLSGIVAAFILTKMITSEMAASGAILLIAIAILAALIVALLCGLVNGMLIAYVGIPAILATLGTMTFYTGIGMAITQGVGVVGFPEQFLAIGSGKIGMLPIPLVIFVLAAIMVSLTLNKTVFGQSVYLFGANPIATLFSGIHNTSVTLKAYLLSGLLAGCSAIIMISRVNSAKVGYGDTYLLQAILVAVLGGVNPYGGRGKVSGVLMGIIILQSLQNAFTLFMFTPYAKRLIWGLMLLLVMIIHYINLRYQERAKIRAMVSQI
ncbi:inner-membrane translocator [Candidatus Vecturithrix granuli]|uniref:Inner-membrane translocator n=1 Tax=Vecturithrix granuli TaxID=1499967 RepID=A0A0S6WBW5_VECG1|nr:inner-membrane translocator [Candidatus Vecturithrix granuli]